MGPALPTRWSCLWSVAFTLFLWCGTFNPQLLGLRLTPAVTLQVQSALYVEAGFLTDLELFHWAKLGGRNPQGPAWFLHPHHCVTSMHRLAGLSLKSNQVFMLFLLNDITLCSSQVREQTALGKILFLDLMNPLCLGFKVIEDDYQGYLIIKNIVYWIL